MAKAKADIRSLARTHTEMALKTLVAIAKQPKAPAAARVAAAQALLDRGWGKPKQEVEHSGSIELLQVLADLDGRSRDLPGDQG